MKTLPACLLCGLLAAASAAAADLSFSVGYGSARLKGGQFGGTSSTDSLLPKDVAGTVNVFRLSVDYALSEKFGIEGSFLNYTELTTEHQLNPNGPQTTVAVDYRFHRKAQALALGPTVNWVPAENWEITAGAGAVLSDLRTSIDGGGHGAQVYKTTGNPGWYGSLGTSFALAKQLSVGASLRYIDFNRKAFSSDTLTALQAEVFLAVHF